MRLIEGVVDEPEDVRVAELEQEVRRLRRAVSDAEQAARDADRRAGEGVAALRRTLSPLYRALQTIFGEIESVAGGESATDVHPANARTAAVWASWKDKLGTGPAKVIDALLLHGEMNTAQLSIATGYHRNTVPQYVSACNKAGLLTKNGGRFSLKKL